MPDTHIMTHAVLHLVQLQSRCVIGLRSTQIRDNIDTMYVPLQTVQFADDARMTITNWSEPCRFATSFPMSLFNPCKKVAKLRRSHPGCLLLIHHLLERAQELLKLEEGRTTSGGLLGWMSSFRLDLSNLHQVNLSCNLGKNEIMVR